MVQPLTQAVAEPERDAIYENEPVKPGDMVEIPGSDGRKYYKAATQAEIDAYDKEWKDYEASPDVLPEPLKRDGDNDGSGARSGIDKVKAAIEKTSAERSELGAVQNRLEHTIRNLDNVAENTTSAESAIRDTDMSSEMVKYSKSNIVAQVGQSMLAQANQSKQGVLNLLG